MARVFLLFYMLVIAVSAAAQTDACPRVWRSGDSLFTDPAPDIQWQRDGRNIPGATQSWLVPAESGSYGVVARSDISPAFHFQRGYVLTGWIFDELHRPIEGAVVKRGDFSAKTDSAGGFTLFVNELPLVNEQAPVLLEVEREGFWRNISRQYLNSDDTTEVAVMLHSKSITNRMDAKEGGELLYQGFSLRIPPNGVQTEDGTPYDGTVLLALEGATPRNPDFTLRMPGGDFTGIDENGEEVMLRSFGYLTAEISTENGERLELRPEVRATLRFYLSWKQTQTTSDSVPLWHFDAETAVWKQDGWCLRNGSVYEGLVSHFSSWNCDWPEKRGTVRGRVVDCAGAALPAGRVRVGQRLVHANRAGEYWSFVPGGLAFDVFTLADTLRNVSVPAMEERDLGEIEGRADFHGFAAWNSRTKEMFVNLVGVIPNDLRVSVDKGLTWTEERHFFGLEQAPEEVWLSGSCEVRLKIDVMTTDSDCRLLSLQELESHTLHWGLDDALAAEFPVYRLDVGLDFRAYEQIANMHRVFPCLQELHWGRTGVQDLYEVPEDIAFCNQLQILRIKVPGLSSLPESIGNLTQLRELEVTDTWVARLPESIGNLKRLHILTLSYNQIVDLPDSIAELADSLRELRLEGSGLSLERKAEIQAMLPNTMIVW